MSEAELHGGDARDAQPFRVLVVDDNRLFARAIASELQQHGLAAEVALSASEALSWCERAGFDAILLDHRLPDEDGIDIIPVLLGRQPRTPILVMTAYGVIPSAIQAIRLGAEDYVVKETSTRPLIERVLELRRRQELRRSATGWDEHRQHGLFGRSQAMVRVREQLDKVAPRTETTVLLTGETGVGKEVAARYLHRLSAPPASPFIAVDCVALPETLVESLLFGHERGAFTGAHRTRKGVFEEAGDGTVFLDEIGDMDLALQGKLLRVLETRRFQRLGSVQELPVRARVIAATNRDLGELVRAGRFRLDLGQRLGVFPIHIPPLRERGDDVLLAANHFVQFFCSKMGLTAEPLPAEVEARLLGYDYPGNVRELKNVVERAVILAASGRITLEHLPERLWAPAAAVAQPQSPATAVDFIPGIDTMETLEAKLIRQALEQTGGARAETARLLGISRFQLLRRMQKFRMGPSGEPGEEEP